MHLSCQSCSRRQVIHRHHFGHGLHWLIWIWSSSGWRAILIATTHLSSICPHYRCRPFVRLSDCVLRVEFDLPSFFVLLDAVVQRIAPERRKCEIGGRGESHVNIFFYLAVSQKSVHRDPRVVQLCAFIVLGEHREHLFHIE